MSNSIQFHKLKDGTFQITQNDKIIILTRAQAETLAQAILIKLKVM